MKYIFVWAYTLLSLVGFSQSYNFKKHEVFYIPSEPAFISINLKSPSNTSENIISYLEKNYLNTSVSEQKLELESVKSSPLGKHYRYKHIFKNMPVFHSFIQANYDNNGQLFMIINNLAQFDGYEIPSFSISHGNFWMNTNYGLTPAYVKEKFDSSKNQSALYYYNNEDKLIFSYNPKLYFQNPDSMVSAMVYLPNPIVATNATYGDKGFVDNNDKDSPELTNARSKVRVPLKFENGKFKLTNRLISLKNLHDPVGNPVEPVDTFLNYTRSQPGFEDINAYYHIYSYSNYLRKIGFESLLDSIIIDPHGANGDDNSFFDPQQYPYEIEYGTGGVDDAEDGQVVIHEFGHSLSTIASFGTQNGNERLAMEEGQADYVCMSYSRSLSKNKPNLVFSWDGHNEIWDGFKTNTLGKYEDLSGIKDVDRELWSTALMCIHDKLRSTKSDSLVFSSYFLQAGGGTMPQMAKVILKLDSMLFNAKDLGKIWQCFTDRGILDTVPGPIGIKEIENIDGHIKFLNTSDFSRGLSPSRILVTYPQLWNRIEIYNNLGQLTHTLKISKETTLRPDEFKSGVYYLKIISTNGENIFSQKIIKF